MMYAKSIKLVLLATAATLIGATTVVAQSSDYPSRPIRLVVPYPAGGGSDIVARAVAAKLTVALGQSVFVDNRSGAGTVIGNDFVAKSAADGYTLLMASSAININPSLLNHVPYNNEKDFVPIANAAFHPFVLVANPALPARNVQELIAYAKKNPGKLSYASVGSGSSQHIEMEVFKQLAGISLVHIPYRGSAPAMIDLLAGRVELMFNGISPTLLHIRNGALKVIAVDSDSRVPLLKDVPTMVESGVRGFKFVTWSGVLAPTGTPQPIIERLAAEMQKITASADYRDQLSSLGLEAGGPAQEQYVAFLRSDMANWARMVKETGAKLD